MRPGDSVGEFTTLNPRWPVTSTPYAIRSLKSAASDTATTAATADIATDATQLGGVAADQYVKTDDPRLGGEGGNFIQNGETQQAGANFNISGNGTVGGTLMANTVTAETGTGFFGLMQTDATTRVGTYVGGSASGAAGGWVGTQSNSPLHLFTNNGQPQVTVTQSGNVGIGTFNPQAKLHVAGNAAQDRDKGGMVKAMLYVDGNVLPTKIVRCYNGITGASAGNCGFTVNRISAGYYEINFGFQVSDRFVTITLQNDPPPIIGGPRNVGANFIFPRNSTTLMNVNTFYTGAAQFEQDAAFMIILY